MISSMGTQQVTGTSSDMGRFLTARRFSITLSFAARLNFPVNFLSDAKKYRNKHCIRSHPSLNSSVQLSGSQKSDSSPSSTSYDNVSQSNAVGIIGGVSVLSTLIFLEKLVLWSSRNGQKGVPFIVCSDPMSNAGLDESFVVENLKSKRVFLEGVQCIVMPCNVSHALYAEISVGCKLPFLHVAKCVARELKEARFRPLEAGCGVKVGLIATEATLMAGFYQDELQKQGFEVAMPDRATMERIVKPSIKCLKQKDIEGARNLLRIAIQGLLVRAVNTVILASDELQCLLPHDDPLNKYCVDPMDALARSAVKWARSAKCIKESSS